MRREGPAKTHADNCHALNAVGEAFGLVLGVLRGHGDVLVRVVSTGLT